MRIQNALEAGLQRTGERESNAVSVIPPTSISMTYHTILNSTKKSQIRKQQEQGIIALGHRAVAVPGTTTRATDNARPEAASLWLPYQTKPTPVDKASLRPSVRNRIMTPMT